MPRVPRWLCRAVAQRRRQTQAVARRPLASGRRGVGSAPALGLGAGAAFRAGTVPLQRLGRRQALLLAAALRAKRLAHGDELVDARPSPMAPLAAEDLLAQEGAPAGDDAAAPPLAPQGGPVAVDGLGAPLAPDHAAIVQTYLFQGHVLHFAPLLLSVDHGGVSPTPGRPEPRPCWDAPLVRLSAVWLGRRGRRIRLGWRRGRASVNSARAWE